MTWKSQRPHKNPNSSWAHHTVGVTEQSKPELCAGGCRKWLALGRAGKMWGTWESCTRAKYPLKLQQAVEGCACAGFAWPRTQGVYTHAQALSHGCWHRGRGGKPKTAPSVGGMEEGVQLWKTHKAAGERTADTSPTGHRGALPWLGKGYKKKPFIPGGGGNLSWDQNAIPIRWDVWYHGRGSCLRLWLEQDWRAVLTKPPLPARQQGRSKGSLPLGEAWVDTSQWCRKQSSAGGTKVRRAIRTPGSSGSTRKWQLIARVIGGQCGPWKRNTIIPQSKPSPAFEQVASVPFLMASQKTTVPISSH